MAEVVRECSPTLPRWAESTQVVNWLVRPGRASSARSVFSGQLRVLSGQLDESSAASRPRSGSNSSRRPENGGHRTVTGHLLRSTPVTPNSRIQSGWEFIQRERNGHDLDS